MSCNHSEKPLFNAHGSWTAEQQLVEQLTEKQAFFQKSTQHGIDLN